MPRTRLSPERRALVERHIPLAVSITGQFSRAYGLDHREMVSVAFEAMVDWAEDYDKDRTQPQTHLGARVRWAMLDEVRLRARRSRRAAFVPLHADLTDPGADPCRGIEDREQAECLLRMACSKDATALRLTFVEGWTHAEAARLMGVSLSGLNLCIQRGLADIRSSLAS